MTPMMRLTNRKTFLLALCTLVSTAMPVEAARETSSGYIVPRDVQGAGGGEEARSTNYKLIDTIGEPNVGVSASLNYNLRAGYRQAGGDAAFLSLAGPATIDLGVIVGTGQRTASGSWTVVTDAAAGYALSWRAATAALTSPNGSIAAFGPTTANVPDTWSVAVADARWGGHLGVASTDTASEWGIDDGINSKWLDIATSNRTIVSRPTRTSVSGSSEIVHFRAEIGPTAIVPNGTYSTTVTMTAVSL